MPYYYRSTTQEVRYMDASFYEAWIDANNPKANDWTEISDPPSTNHSWNGTQWMAPPSYVPQQITRFQGKAILMQRGLLDQVETAVAASTDPLVALAWKEALTFDRQSSMVITITQQLGLTSAQVDQMFIDGSKIN